MATCARERPSERKVATELRKFRDIIKDVGTGAVTLSMDDSTGLARIKLCHESHRNALCGRMMAQFADAVDALEKWDRGVAVLLTAEGKRAFCAGVDLYFARTHLTTSEDGRLMCHLMTDALNRMRALPMVSFVAIEGPAVGGGAEMTTAFDYRVMSDKAYIHFVEVQMGVSTGWGGGARLVNLLGRREALRALAWSEAITPDMATKLGLADKVISTLDEEAGGAEGGALKMIQPLISQHNWQALRAIKTVIAEADSIEDAVQEEEIRNFAAMWGGKDNKDAVEHRKEVVQEEKKHRH